MEDIINNSIQQDTAPAVPQRVEKIGEEQIKKARDILSEYKRDKASLESKIVQNEQFWKLRHWKDEWTKDDNGKKVRRKFTPATAWLWNTIVSKHADMEDAFPEPNVLPREQGDTQEAEALSEIIPVVLEQNDFRKTYSDCGWYKLKQGASAYNVLWDKNKLNGLGDISITRVDLLNLFWEAGIQNIQDSQNLFYTQLVDNDVLKSQYPQLADKQLQNDGIVKQYIYDDTVSTSDKSVVVDWYYRKLKNGKTILHYVKFVGDVVLYATENETQPDAMGYVPANDGLYAHGKYPFVIDSLFDIEGSPVGYGFTDIFKDQQICIDQLTAVIGKNAQEGATRRFFVSDDADINLTEFANYDNEIIRVSSNNISDEKIREINANPLGSIYVDYLNQMIEALKETSGNRDVSNGGVSSGVTSASGIAALQEASSKSSRDLIGNTYEAYKDIVLLVLELIRQFYTVPRQFRILGANGEQKFTAYDNSGIAPIPQGNDFGIDMGYRVPQFDIKVSAQKQNPYSKLAQNELMLQFFQLGFFNPQLADQALSCLKGMDFDGKDEVIKRIEETGNLAQAFAQLTQIAVSLAGAYDQRFLPEIQNLAMMGGAEMQMPQAMGNVSLEQNDSLGSSMPEEHPFVQRAKEQAMNATQPR